VAVEAALEEPLRGRGSGLFAAPLLLLPLLLGCDPPAGALEVGFLDALEEEELLETGGVRVVHVFDITAVLFPRHTRVSRKADAA
jgi:hypothetical protein